MHPIMNLCSVVVHLPGGAIWQRCEGQNARPLDTRLNGCGKPQIQSFARVKVEGHIQVTRGNQGRIFSCEERSEKGQYMVHSQTSNRL